MTEYRRDLVMQLIEEVGFLVARAASLRALGLTSEVQAEVERLSAAAEALDAEDRRRVLEGLAALDEVGRG